MEFKPESAILHYACAFEIKEDSDQTMSELRKNLAMWIGNKEKIGAALIKTDFFLGNQGQNKIGKNNSLLRTAAHYGEFSSDNPYQWALEYIHRDSQPYRLWSTEVGLTRHDGWIRFAVALNHWVRPGYILHDIPLDPNPTAPFFIREIIRQFECKKYIDDSEPLSSDPIVVNSHNVKNLVNAIQSPYRNVPIILIAPEVQIETNESILPLNVNLLTKIVSGNANVYYFESGEIRRQFQDLVSYEMACLPYSLRIYMPKTSDGKKHRFFDKRFFEEHGYEEVISLVWASISRYGHIFKANEIITIKDVVHKRNFEFLKTKLLSKENTENISSKIQEYEEYFNEISMEHQELENRNKELEQINTQFLNELQLLKHVRETNQIENDCSDLNLFPQRLDELLIQGCKIFHSQLDYTERAITSSSKASLEKKYYLHAWSAIKDMATVLHPLIFQDESNDFEGEFNKRSIYQMAKTEGKQTKGNSKLMRLRQDKYKGNDIDITMHLKYGNDRDQKKIFRIHFFIDKEKHKIIIGHFGDHLDNSIT